MLKFNLYFTNSVRSILILFLCISLKSIGQTTEDSTSVIKELSDRSIIDELESDTLHLNTEYSTNNQKLREKLSVKKDSTRSKGNAFKQAKDRLKSKSKDLKTQKNDSIANNGDSLKQTAKGKLGIRNKGSQIFKKDTTGHKGDSLKQITKDKLGIKDKNLQIFKKDTTGHKGDSLKQSAKERLGIKDKNLEIFKKDTTGHKRDSLKQIAKGKLGIKDKDLNMFKKATTGHRRDSLKQIAKGKLGINDKNLQIFKKDTTGHRRDSLKQLAKEKLGINKCLQMFKRDTTGHRMDSLKKIAKEKLGVKKKDFRIHGVLSNQFDYGTVPYYIPNTSTPIGLLKSQGDLKFSAKKIPFLFNYFYMNPANLLGLQNYFTLKFDYETYQENLRNEVAEKKAGYLKKLKDTEYLKQQYEQKLGYLKYLNQLPEGFGSNPLSNYTKLDTSGLKNKFPTDTLSSLTSKIDTAEYKKKFQKDTLSVPYSDIDTAAYKNAYKDSLATKMFKDSTYKKITEYKEKIEMYEAEIKEYDQKIKLLNDPKQLSSIDNPYLSKAKNFLGNIRRFEIGMCYPNYSTFLVNNLTLKGINAEYATSNYFVNLTYGKTINNLLNQPQTNSSIINSFVQTASFFDLSKKQDARKILSGKIGLGNANTSYIAFGALYGIGKQNFFNTASGKETNLVYELDGKTTIKGYVLSASYAKSFINQEGSDNNTEPLTKMRNNALQLRFSGVMPYLKTKFTLGYRIIDPFFKSYGTGFLRTDNIRYEGKLEQVITSKFKIGINYRRDADNILNRHGFKSSINYISTSVRLKLFRKRLDINLIYTPIIQKIKNLTDKSIIVNKSDMKNVVVCYSPKFKKVVTTLTGIYSQYSIYDNVSVRNLENFNLGIVNVFRSSFKIGANSSFYNSNVSDSASSSPKTILSSLEVGYSFKKSINTSLRVKHSYNLTGKTNQYGLGFNVDFPITKYFSLELHAEKLILGDFYNSLNVSNIELFPYYGYIKLNVKL